MTGDRPDDAQTTWYLDDHQCPEAVGPLTQSLYPYVFQGFSKVHRERGRQKPPRMRTLFVYGYLYVDLQPPQGPLSDAGKRSALLSPLQWEREWLPEIAANLNRLYAHSLDSLADDELAGALQEALRMLGRHWEIHHSLSLGAVNELNRWYKERFPNAATGEPAKLVQGLGNRSADSAQALWELAQTAPEQFEANLSRFLDEFGHRPANYCDVGSPTWIEDPKPVLAMVDRYRAEGAPAPLAGAQSHTDEREALVASVRAQLSPDELAQFEERLALAQAANRAGEDHNFWIEGRTMAAIRRICIEFGRRMATAGIIPVAEDVSLLTVNELVHFGYGAAQPHLRTALEERRAEHEANRQHKPAAWVGQAPEDEEEPEADEQDPALLKGTAVSAGLVRGIARVASSMAEALSLRRGEVLICKETDPGWTPFLALAGAVVLESFAGGMLAHAAVVAREFRIPAVVGVNGALGKIKSGQTVEVDGTGGVVRILE